MTATDKNFEGMKPPKPEPQTDIICVKCKQYSGWNNESIGTIKIDSVKKIYCKNCGKVTIKLIPTGYPNSL